MRVAFDDMSVLNIPHRALQWIEIVCFSVYHFSDKEALCMKTRCDFPIQ